jgi:hypothetical protein
MKTKATEFIEALEQKANSGLTTNRMLDIIFNTDLRCGHTGLTLLAKNLKVKPDNLRAGEYIVFVNRKKSALKIFASGNVVAHFKMPGEQQMNVKVFSLIPRFFNGKELNYSGALSEVIRKEIRQ